MGAALVRAFAAAPLAALAVAAPAAGHGPCRCLDPIVVEPGGRVRVSPPVERVVLNPRPGDLGTTPRHFASAFRADVPTTTVVARGARLRRRPASFRLPAGTPGGVFLVVVFDGGEGGAHSSEDLLHVVGDGAALRGVVAVAGRAPVRPAAPSPRAWPAGTFAAGALAGVAATVAVLVAARRRRA